MAAKWWDVLKQELLTPKSGKNRCCGQSWHQIMVPCMNPTVKRPSERLSCGFRQTMTLITKEAKIANTCHCERHQVNSFYDPHLLWLRDDQATKQDELAKGKYPGKSVKSTWYPRGPAYKLFENTEGDTSKHKDQLTLTRNDSRVCMGEYRNTCVSTWSEIDRDEKFGQFCADPPMIKFLGVQ